MMLGFREELTLVNVEYSGNCGSLYGAGTHPAQHAALADSVHCCSMRGTTLEEMETRRIRR